MKQRKLLAVLSATILGITSLHAASINEPFQAPENGIPESWFVAPFKQKKPYSPAIVQESAGAYYLRFLRTQATDQAAVYYIGESKSPSTANQFSDFEGSVIIRLVGSAQNHGGILLRADQLLYSHKGDQPLNAYYIAIRGGSGHSPIAIYQDPEGYLPRDLGEPVAAAEPGTPPLKTNQDYKLVFSARGKTIQATLYKATGDNRFDQQIATISWGEADRQSGYVGLRCNIGKPEAGIQFRAFQIKE